MFEARFQSFDDPKPAATGPRVEALRAELKKRDLTGFILPRADRHQNEYVPPSEERLAWLTGFTGSAGCAIVLRGQGAPVHRRALHAPGPRAGGRRLSSRSCHMAETSPAEWLAAAPASRRAAGLRSVAAHGGGRRAARPHLHRCRRSARAGRAEPDRRALDRPARAAVRPGRPARPALSPANIPAPRSRASAPRCRRCAPTRW